MVEGIERCNFRAPGAARGPRARNWRHDCHSQESVSQTSLHAAQWIFDEGSKEQQDTIRDLALQGLKYLGEELRYNREPDYENDFELPMLRLRSTQLAKTMADRGFENDSTVVRWLEIARQDPLPEVRYVKGLTSMRQQKDGTVIDNPPDADQPLED